MFMVTTLDGQSLLSWIIGFRQVKFPGVVFREGRGKRNATEAGRRTGDRLGIGKRLRSGHLSLSPRPAPLCSRELQASLHLSQLC